MEIQFSAIGLWFTADVDYAPEEPMVTTGPSENWHPGNPDSVDFNTLTADYELHGVTYQRDAMFLLDGAIEVWGKIDEAARIACREMGDDK